MKSDFLIALTQLAAERNLPRETVLSAIEAALVSAFRKDSVTAGQNISVTLDPGSGEISVFVLKTVVEEVEDPQQEMLLEEARKIKPNAEIGDGIPTDSLPHSAGRIAAQTAKQVVLQRLREAERELVYEEFADKEGEVFTVTVQRMEARHIIVELGRAEAILPPMEQVPIERYRVGMRMKVLLQSVGRSTKGPELIVSRADNQLLRRLFEMEVPEIYNGAVEIMGIAREPGARSKVAVFAKQTGVDPVGSCVGLRGIRIQNIVNELHGEKIDVVQWDKDTVVFLANSLSPSLVMRVDLDPETGTATAIVSDRQLSLAIGREGQNARLAAKLTGWKVDIKSPSEAEPAEGLEQAADGVEEPAAAVVSSAEEQPPEVEKPEEAQVAKEAEPALALESVGVTETEPLVEVPAAEVEAPATATDEPEVVPAVPDVDLPPEVLAPEFMPEVQPEEVPVPAVEQTSLRDLSESIWATAGVAPQEPGQIRFAEDIVDLRGGVTARRGRKASRVTQQGSRKRRGGRGGRRTRGVFRA